MSGLAPVTPIRRDPVPGMRIESIRVEGRHRKDLGDIAGLAASIGELGLLAPVVVTRDGCLIAGERRLEACRYLGWDSIPVVVPDSLADAASLLKAERDENVCRKGMLPSELATLGASLHEVEAEAARQRQRQAGRNHGRGQIASGGSARSYLAHGTRDAIGEALGIGGRTYAELRYAHQLAHDESAPPEERELAREALRAMDQGKGITSAGRELRQKIRVTRRTPPADADPKPQPLADADSEPPPPTAKDREAVKRRWQIIVEMAAQGHSSRQIAKHLGITAEGLRAGARMRGVEIPADKVIGKTFRHDSARIVRETVSTLEGIAMGIELVDPDELDPAEALNWATSLTQSIRVLNRLIKELKEVAQ